MATNKLWQLALILCVALPTPALAWGEYGHRTIATLAMADVRPSTRAAISRLLRHANELATPTCRLRSPQDASVWPDCIRGLKERFNYTAPWHYQNVDVCKPFDLKSACKDGNCVSVQITRNAHLLADKTLPPRERLMALAFLIHFVGDLHMPLHAGDRSDRGGNDQKGSYGMVAGSRMNIHGIWDGALAERAISTPPGGATGLRLSPAGESALAGGTPDDWSREGWTLAQGIYASAQGGDICAPRVPRATLSNAQIETLIPTVRLQIQRAGARLARLLNEALG